MSESPFVIDIHFSGEISFFQPSISGIHSIAIIKPLLQKVKSNMHLFNQIIFRFFRTFYFVKSAVRLVLSFSFVFITRIWQGEKPLKIDTYTNRQKVPDHITNTTSQRAVLKFALLWLVELFSNHYRQAKSAHVMPAVCMVYTAYSAQQI